LLTYAQSPSGSLFPWLTLFPRWALYVCLSAGFFAAWLATSRLSLCCLCFLLSVFVLPLAESSSPGRPPSSDKIPFQTIVVGAVVGWLFVPLCSLPVSFFSRFPLPRTVCSIAPGQVRLTRLREAPAAASSTYSVSPPL